MTTRILLLAALALAVTGACACADATSFYHAISWDVSTGACSDLGTLTGGTDSRAYAINQYGQIAGWSTNSTGVRDAVRWDSTGIVDLGAGSAYAINADGQTVGESNGEAVMWDANGNMHDIGAGIAYGINGLGQVVGSLYTTDTNGSFEKHAFLWSVSSGLTDLGKLDGTIGSSGRAINSDGAIAGVSLVNSDYGEAFIGLPGQPWQGVCDGIAVGINEADQVIGNSLLGAGFIWNPTTGVTSIGMSANGINRVGEVAGTTTGNKAAIWTLGGGISELPLPGGSIRSVAYGLNDHDAAVGWAMFITQGFVPEPSSVLALLVGLVGLVGLRSVRRSR